MRSVIFGVRKAVEGDLEAIAKLHILSWQTAYKGFIPDEILFRQTIEGSLGGWRSTHSSYPDNLSVAETREGVIVGFCCAGPVVDHKHSAPFEFEIYGIHVSPNRHREGVGTLMLKDALQRMNALSLRGAIVWTLENLIQSRRFYEKCGGSVVRSGEWKNESHTQGEVAYGWRTPD